jgi:hypothetical protein
VVEAQEAANALAADDRSGRRSIGWRLDESPTEALVVALGVVVGEVLADRGAQMALSEKDELAEALATCRRALLNKSLARSRS